MANNEGAVERARGPIKSSCCLTLPDLYGPPLHDYGSGRRCKQVGCKTILRYCNPGPFCSKCKTQMNLAKIGC